MTVMLSSDEVRKQSLSVWGQFGEKLWIPNARENVKLERHNMNELEHFGVGKFCVLVAMGSSLEDNIDVLKKYRDHVDIICCDKAFGPLLDHGIKADSVVLADAGIPYKYIENHVKETEDVNLFATPYANPAWTKTWLGKKYFYINQDAIGSEQIFLKIFGDKERVIPASSNVSNAMLVLLSDCGSTKNHNWAGYEQIYLLGYDYSWPANGNYYAWDNPKPKRFYMSHRTFPLKDYIAFSSENLIFSAKWLQSYVTSFKLPVKNATEKGIIDRIPRINLENELKRINPSKRNYDLVIDTFKAWKETFYASKRAEHNFNTFRRELLWQ